MDWYSRVTDSISELDYITQAAASVASELEGGK